MLFFVFLSFVAMRLLSSNSIHALLLIRSPGAPPSRASSGSRDRRHPRQALPSRRSRRRRVARVRSAGTSPGSRDSSFPDPRSLPCPSSARRQLPIDPCLGIADRDISCERDLGCQQRPCATNELAFARSEP